MGNAAQEVKEISARHLENAALAVQYKASRSVDGTPADALANIPVPIHRRFTDGRQ
jgi:hypothetical protein